MSPLRKFALIAAAAVLPSCFFTCNSLVDYCAQSGQCICPSQDFESCCVPPGLPCKEHSDCCGGGATCVAGACTPPKRLSTPDPNDTCLPAEQACSVFADGGNDCCSLNCVDGVCRCHAVSGGHCESEADCCYRFNYGRTDYCTRGPYTCAADSNDGG